MTDRNEPPIRSRITIDLDDRQLRDPRMQEAIQTILKVTAEQSEQQEREQQAQEQTAPA